MLAIIQTLLDFILLVAKALFKRKHHGKSTSSSSGCHKDKDQEKKQEQTCHKERDQENHVSLGETSRRRRRSSITETTTITKTTEFVVSGDSSENASPGPEKTSTRKVRFKE